MPSSILKNSLAVFASRVANGAGQLAVTLLVARAVDVPAFGRFAFGLTAGNFAAVLAEAGTGLALVRDVARDRESAERYFGTLLTLRLGASLAVLAVAAAAAWALADPALAAATALGLGIGLIRGLSRHATALFYGLERMELETGVLLVEATLSVAAVLTGVLLHFGLERLMALLLAAFAVGLLLRFVVSGRLLGRRVAPAWDTEIARLIRAQAMPYALFAFFSVVYLQVDVPLVTFGLGEAHTGLYQAAAKIFVFLMLVPEGISNALLPAAAREGDPRRLEGLGATVAFWLVALGLPVAVGGALLARPLMVLLYGARYAAAGTVFALLMVAVPLRFHAYVQGTLLTAGGVQGRRARAMGLAALLTVVGVLVGMLAGGLAGVAASRLVVEVALVVAYGVGLGARLARRTVPPRLGRLAVAAAVMAGAVWLAAAWPVLARVALGAVVYGVVAAATRALPRRIRPAAGGAT